MSNLEKQLENPELFMQLQCEVKRIVAERESVQREKDQAQATLNLIERGVLITPSAEIGVLRRKAES